MQQYTVKKLAVLAGISVRTLHYYDRIGLLKPDSHSPSGYRQYSETALLVLQQILFFRELGFNLAEIRRIVTSPDFDVIEALRSQREILVEQAQRTRTLIRTLDSTLQKLKGEKNMDIKEYYRGFSEEQIERYRSEVRRRWGEKTLADSEARILKMGKAGFESKQAEGHAIFQSIADQMPSGFDSPEVQRQVTLWREWLENFSHYSDQAILGLGRLYSENAEFAAFFQKIHPDLPAFLTRAIEFYCASRQPAAG